MCQLKKERKIVTRNSTESFLWKAVLFIVSSLFESQIMYINLINYLEHTYIHRETGFWG